MKFLGEKGVKFVLFEASLIYIVISFIAPKLLGGKNSITSIRGNGFE
jgi:riboflavin biosynthesis pyrimidine reductase